MNYTDERNVQMLIFLLKYHNIKKIIASPGTTNMTFIGSIQSDPFFEIYSSVDERSAAYMACGLSVESNEPVVLSCTGATASRNYFPGLTEAFYRKLPILAVTSTQHEGKVGLNCPQVIDRTLQPRDCVRKSVHIPLVHCKEDEWTYALKLNDAILELYRNGCGPVHINLATNYSHCYDCRNIIPVQTVDRYFGGDTNWPSIEYKKIGIFVGAHKKWDEKLLKEVEEFCNKYNAVVYCDATSNYTGKFAAYACILANQDKYISDNIKPDLLIDIGDISGNYSKYLGTNIWRVNPDGEIRAPFRKVDKVFESKELDFFRFYNAQKDIHHHDVSYLDSITNEIENLANRIPELPFSNVWIAQKVLSELPNNSTLYLGILNSLRTWSYFKKPDGVTAYCNTGGFGIDGGMSSLVGVSLANKSQIAFGVFGDLQFFYDMNVLGNRHLGNNIRIIVVNNGIGAEFKNYFHDGAAFGEDANDYISAKGHFGNKSKKLIKHYAEDLGFEYMSASNKEEFEKEYKCFLEPKINRGPIIFEVFTTDENESKANYLIRNIETSISGSSKDMLKSAIGEKNIKTIKKLLGRN